MDTLQQTAHRITAMIAGKPRHEVEPEYRCDTCKDLAYVTAKDGRSMEPCPACSLLNKIAARVPERYRDARLEHFSETVNKGVQQWIAKPTDGLFVYGPVGVGKSYLAWAALIVWWAIPRRGGSFLRAEQFYRKLRDSYNAERGSESDVLQPYFDETLLALDDLGAGSLSDHERRLTLEVLNVRNDHVRPTIVTTNWNLEQIAERMDDRIASRLSGFTRVELAGKDRRVR